MRTKQNPCGLGVATMLAIILALHPLGGLAFADTTVPQPVSYRFISIDLPNSSGDLGLTSLADINNDGAIIGGFADSSGFGFLLGDTFRVTDIQCPGDTNAAPNAQPQSINKHGEISGFCRVGGRLHGFFRGKKETYTLLDFPGANLTEATGINDDGQVVGDYRDSDGRFHGFLWDAGRFFTIDVPFPDVRLIGPNGINNVGQIVGFYDDTTGGRHGFLSDRGHFISFDVPGSQLTAPADINDDGQIVGVYVVEEVLQSFLLEHGRFTTIHVPFSDAVFTEVRGINNRGQIVGRYVRHNPDDLVNPFSSHGFIATPHSEPQSPSRRVGSQPHDAAHFKRWTQYVEERDDQFGKWRRLP